MRIIFIFGENRLRSIRALVRNADEQIAAAAFIAKIATSIQPSNSDCSCPQSEQTAEFSA